MIFGQFNPVQGKHGFVRAAISTSVAAEFDPDNRFGNVQGAEVPHAELSTA